MDIIKLDAAQTQVEVDSERAETMRQALLVLCGERDLMIVVEGIETEWQVEALARLGCRATPSRVMGAHRLALVAHAR